MIWETVNTLGFYLFTFLPVGIILALSLKSVKEQRKKEGGEAVKGGKEYLWAIAGILVFIVWYNFGDFNFKRTQRPPRTTSQYTATRDVIPQQVEQTGNMTWHRQSGEKGQPSDNLTIVVNKNDAEDLVFTARYSKEDGTPLASEFQGKWNKNNQRYEGAWSQSYPEASGEWYLQQNKEDKKVYEGELTEKTENKPLTLKIELD